MRAVVRVMMKESGKDINEILDMPFTFFMEVLEEESKPSKQKSLISAFGG